MKRIYIVVAFIVIAAMIFTGCSAAAPQTGNGSYENKDNGVSVDAPEGPAEAPAAQPETGLADPNVIGRTGDGSTQASEISVLEPGVNRKVVYNGTIVANTKEFDKDYDKVMDQLRLVGGYVESSNIDGSKPEDREDAGRTAQMVLRVPNDKFDSFITMLKGMGQNLKTNISGQDISLQYYDTETQLSTLRNRQSRLEEMLKNPAYTLDSIIQLEKELADVSYQIQMLETNLRTYDSLIDFSTINITLYEVAEITAVMPAKEDLGTRISNGFYSVLNVLAAIGEGLLIFFASGSPILIPLALIIVLIILLVKRSHKKRGAKPAPPWTQGGQNDVKPQ